MTDTDNTTEQTETTFGIDTTQAYDNYLQATDEAHARYRKAMDASLNELHTATAAVTRLLDGDHIADDINSMLANLSMPRRKQLRDDARREERRLLDEATATRDEALAQDPFSAFLISDELAGYRSCAREILRTAPHTFATLRDLANTERWCETFEEIAEKATEMGALPEEYRTVTRPVYWRDVPADHDAWQGQQWVVHVKLPAYVRDTDAHGCEHTLDHLIDHSVHTRYEKVADAPEQAPES